MIAKLNEINLSEGFKLKTLVTVEELSNHDMVYIYHHIKSNDVVQLRFSEESLLGELIYSVHFKAFQLGVIRIKGVMKDLYQGIHELDAVISGVSKKKYLPFSGLDIAIHAQAMRLVS